MRRVVVFGRARQGGFEMRGRSLAHAFGWKAFDVAERARPREVPTCDVAVLVKYDCGLARKIRNRCGMLIWDPLDCWMKSRHEPGPYSFFEKEFARVGPDVVVATSTSCAKVMATAAGYQGKRPKVVTIRHHHDPRIRPDWHDPKGGVVYCGGRQYIKKGIKIINKACLMIGRPFRLIDGNGSWVKLKGAGLSLCPRLPPYSGSINRLCKPQVKLENSVAAGIPVLCTDDPCCASVGHRPEAVTVAEFMNVQSLYRAMSRTLERGPLDVEIAFTFDEFAHEMKKLVDEYVA